MYTYFLQGVASVVLGDLREFQGCEKKKQKKTQNTFNLTVSLTTQMYKGLHLNLTLGESEEGLAL